MPREPATTPLSAPLDQENPPRLAFTMGDPTGIGPELIARVWAEPSVHTACRPVVIGDPATLARAAARWAPSIVVVTSSASEEVVDSSPRRMACIASRSTGRPGAPSGQLAYEAVAVATEMALRGEVQGVVTAPLSKANLHAAGHAYPGHTELLAERCGVDDFAMMLYLPPGDGPAGEGSPARGPHGLGVVHTTLHTSLRSVFDLLTPEAIVEKCLLADRMFRRLGCEQPRVAVAALNPHAGEGGLFGDEEQTILRPAVERAKAEGVEASGPYPVDTLMGRAAAGEFDAVVAMYHDQGHIALKLLDMHGAVNVTCGLPIVRTSVAHGTATDRAWRGGAESPTIETRGMVAAITTAARLATNHDPA